LVEVDFQLPALMLKFTRPVEWMERVGRRHSRALRVLGDLSVLVGMAGMVLAGALLARGAWDILKGGPAQVGLVIPGVHIPGSPIYVPLVEGLIAVFLLAVFHEGMHGLMAAAEGVASKYAALILFIIIPAAGVEIDEEKLGKKGKLSQLRIFAAGSMGNFILAALCLGLLFPAGRLMSGMVDYEGLRVHNTSNLPLEVGEVIVGVDGQDALSLGQLQEVLERMEPGQAVKVTTLNRTLEGRLTGEGKLGVYLDQEFSYTSPLARVVGFLVKVLGLSLQLNIGVGLINLLPLGILDGGRMMRVVGGRWYKLVSGLSLALLLFNLVGPYVF